MTKITVFTPTYNRLHTLSKLYQSLKDQTCCDFEWLVIDDGSQDETEKFFVDILKFENKFKVRYLKVKNGGKHRAINLALDKAEGEFFFIVDSDDYLTNNSIELIIKWINEISKLGDKYAGVSGLRGYNKDKMIGKSFKGKYVDCTALDKVKHNIEGDKSEVYRTDILRKYKFPEIAGEKFIRESVVWDKIGNDGYLLRWYNKINYICEYRSDGLTMQGSDLHRRNFKGYTLHTKEFLTYRVSMIRKLQALMGYIYIGRLNNASYKELSKNIEVSFALLCGVALLRKILKKGKVFYKKLVKLILYKTGVIIESSAKK